MLFSLNSLPPLIEDHVHSLGQVVHGAVGGHRRVPLVAGPEEGEAESHDKGHAGNRNKAVNKKDKQSDAIRHV